MDKRANGESDMWVWWPFAFSLLTLQVGCPGGDWRDRKGMCVCVCVRKREIAAGNPMVDGVKWRGKRREGKEGGRIERP